MLFSIIIPTYNRAHIITETLHSVLKQGFTDYEIIVVDDGSTDNTKEVLEKINSEKIVYYYKPNEERSIARNFGADKANGRYLIFLDSDDKMREDHLSIIYQCLDANYFKPLFLFTGYVIFNTDGSRMYEFSKSGIFNKKKLFYGNFLGCSSVVIETDLFRRFYFNTDKRLILFEDWELWLRVIVKTPLYCIPGQSIIMINHTGRSVLNYDFKELVSKIFFFKDHVLTKIEPIYSSFANKHRFLMGVYSYASLHIALTGKNRSASIKYLVKSFINNPTIIFKRRFFGILKQLF